MSLDIDSLYEMGVSFNRLALRVGCLLVATRFVERVSFGIDSQNATGFSTIGLVLDITLILVKGPPIVFTINIGGVTEFVNHVERTRGQTLERAPVNP